MFSKKLLICDYKDSVSLITEDAEERILRIYIMIKIFDIYIKLQMILFLFHICVA